MNLKDRILKLDETYYGFTDSLTADLRDTCMLQDAVTIKAVIKTLEAEAVIESKHIIIPLSRWNEVKRAPSKRSRDAKP